MRATSVGSSCRSRGLTLIELLAVTGLLGLCSGVVAVGIGGAAGRATVDAIGQRIVDLDAQARRHVVAVGAVTIAVNRESGAIELRERRGALIARVAVEGECSVALRGAGPRDSIAIDARGRSPDYSIVVSRGSDWAEWQIAGLTGWAFRAGEP